MKRIGQLILCIVAFIGATILIDILNGYILTDPLGYANPWGVLLLGNYNIDPALEPVTSMHGLYFAYIQSDTLGWLTNLFLSGSQNLETLASIIQPSDFVVGYAGRGPIGLIPIMIEENSTFSPLIFYPALCATLRLVVPLVVLGIVAGGVAPTKKVAIQNAIIAMMIIAVAGIVLNIIHVMAFPFNWENADWKFDATIQLNPVFGQIQDNAFLMGDPLYYVLAMSIVAFVYALINGAIISILAAMVALKK